MANESGNRFGEIAVREGFATRAQVKECLEIQAKLRGYGVEPKKIGEILVEKGYLKPGDVLAILDVQRQGGSRIENRSGEGAVPSRGRVRSAKEVSTAETEVAPPRRDDRHPDGDVLPTPEIPGYEILSLLGRGGMGAVYKARQKSLDRTVALKVLPPRAAKDESFIKKFISEARTVAKLNHENVIAGIDVGEANGTYYFAMEHVEGESLARVVERDGPMDERRALEIAKQIARALEHAHKHGLVHRDVKPQNILIAKNDVAKLCDLGLAKQMGQDDKGEPLGIPLGTPHYLSPEQARGEADVDIRSDIYSLGATLYHVLTGRPPFDGDSPMVLMTKHLTEEPVAPRKRNPEVSKATSELILQMMSKDKEDRHQSPTEVLDDIERVLAGKKTKGPSPGGRSGGSSGTRRKKRTTTTGKALERRGGVAVEDDEEVEPRRRTARAVAVRDGGGRDSSSAGLVAAIVSAIVVLVVAVVMFSGDKGPSVYDENDAQRAYEIAEGNYQTARGADQLTPENRAIVRRAFQRVIEQWPGTKGAANARKRLDELGGAGD